MRLEWLEDILAVLETGSLNRAAQQRLLTQPAFSRRMKVIENYVGVELLDRSRKPAQLHKSVRDQQDRIRELAAGIHELLYELKRQDREIHNRVIVASQHAITTSMAPGLVKRLTASMDLSIRLRSANRDQCLGLLITKQANMMISYRAAFENMLATEDYLEEIIIGREQLIPVFGTSFLPMLKDNYAGDELPVIAYPADVFFGQVMSKDLFPRMQSTLFIKKKAETALTLAALQLSLAGVGVAWVPYALAADGIADGKLTDLQKMLPSSELSTVVTRFAGKKSKIEEAVWDLLCLEATM